MSDRFDRISVLLDSPDPAAADELLPLVYDQLRQLARARLRRETPGQTLQATALVHEAFLRVRGSEQPEWEGRRHFFAAAAEAMRRILIEQHRRRQRLRHGGGHKREAIDDEELVAQPFPVHDLLALEDALHKLEAADPRAREIINCRYFVGMTDPETADALGLSLRTVERQWQFIRTFLQAELGGGRAAVTPAELRQAQALFVAALERPLAERAAWLAAQHDVPSAVRAQVDKQLALLDRLPNELERPPEPILPEPPPPSVLQRIEARGERVSPVLLGGTDDDSGPLITTAAPGTAGPAGTVDHYQIQGEIARGGVGIVFKGHDTDLGRQVAMKVLHEEHARRPEMIQRFVEEAQIGGQLQHPGIVPVYELGLQADQRPYFTMKLVKGKTLAARLAERDDPAHDRQRLIAIFAQVCQTIAYAHSRGVLHRDLKPGNVMIGSYGEVQVVDWGMAKVLGRRDGRSHRGRGHDDPSVATVRSKRRVGSDHDSSHSRSGSVMGTPAYMAPEQARGEVEELDPRADVFSLGAMLCEILTGAPPYRGPSSADVLAKAAAAELADALARLDGCGADPGLVAVARTCLAAERAERPRDAGVVSERVTAWLDGIAERAREADVRAATARRTQKLLAAVVGVVAVGLATSLWFWRDADSQRRVAEQRRVELGESNQQLAVRAYAGALHNVHDMLDEGRPDAALAQLESLDSALGGWEWRWLHARARALQPKHVAWDFGPSQIPAAEFDPTGRRLFLNWTAYASATEGHVGVFKVDSSADGFSGRLLWKWRWTTGDFEVQFARFDPSGDRLLLVARDGRMRLVDAADGPANASAMVTGEFGGAVGPVTSESGFGPLAFAPDGSIVLGGRDGSLRRFDRTLAPLGGFAAFATRAAAIAALVFDRDGRRLFVGDADGWAEVIDAATGAAQWPAARLPGYRGRRQVADAAFAPDGSELLLTGEGGHVYVLDAETGQVAKELAQHRQVPTDNYQGWSVRFSSDGRLAVTSGTDGACLYDAASWRLLARMSAALPCFGPADDAIVALGLDLSLSRWDVASLVGTAVFARDLGTQGIALTPDARQAHCVSVGANATNGLRTFDAHTGAQVRARLGRDLASAWSVAVSPDGSRVALGLLDQRILVLDAASGDEVLRIEPAAADLVRPALGRPPVGVNALAWVPDPARPLLAAGIGTPNGHRDPELEVPVLLYDATTGGLVQTLRGARASINKLAVDDAGELLATTDLRGDASVWNLRTAAPLTTRASGSTVAFMPGGKVLLVGTQDGQVVALDCVGGGELWQLAAHGDRIAGISFLDAGRRMCTLGWACDLRVWDTATRARLLTLELDPAFGRTMYLQAWRDTDRIAIGCMDIGALMLVDTAPPAPYSTWRRNGEAARLVDGWVADNLDPEAMRGRLAGLEPAAASLRQAARAAVDGLDGPSLRAAARQAVEHFDAGRTAEALAICAQLERDPDRGPFWTAANLYEPCGRYDEAQRAYERALETGPDRGLVHAALAQIASYRFDVDAVHTHVAAARNQLYVEGAVVRCSKALTRIGELDASIALLALLPDDNYARHNNTGAWSLRHGETGRAAAHLDEARQAGLFRYQALTNLAELALREGRLQQALLWARRAVAVREDRDQDPGAWPLLTLARVLLAAGQRDEALQQFERAFQRRLIPSSHGAAMQYAVALTDAGDEPRARELLESRAERFAQEPFAWEQLARWLAMRDSPADRDHAVDIARKAVELSNHNSPKILATLAEALHASGRTADAIRVAEEARAKMRGRNVEYLTVDEIDERLARYRR